MSLAARKVRLDWGDTQPQFVPGDVFTSHVINVLSLLLPAGERWFCKVLRQVQVDDPDLAADLRGFIAQEATHARAHALLLEHYRECGLDITPITREVELLFDGLLADAPLGIDLGGVRAWLHFRVGIIAAIEQFTCVLGHWILEARALDAAGADPKMLELLRWHGAEEVEHASVAFDVLQTISGGHSARVLHMALVFPAMIAVWVRATQYLMHTDPAACAEATGVLRGLVRYAKTSRESRTLPRFGMLASAALRYCRRSFHPSQEGSRDAALDLLAGYFNAQA